MSTDVVRHQGVRTLLQRLALEASVQTSDENKSTFVLDIMEGIATAQTAEDVFAAQEQGSLSGKDFVDRPFGLSADGIEWVRSTLDNSGSALPVYARLRITDLETEDELTLNCGGSTFVATLARLQDINYWEVSDDNAEGVIRTFRFQVKATAGGNEVLMLKPFNLPKTASNGKGKK